jgi:hypothetical protein
MLNYKKQAIQKLTIKILIKGYRVFIAKNGEYGFFTNDSGSRLVSFQCDLGGITFSGNYKTNNPRQTGTGWRIGGGNIDIDQVFNAYPPRWALGCSSFKYTTLEQHLNFYGRSSGYTEYSIHCDYETVQQLASEYGYNTIHKIENNCFYVDNLVKNNRVIWSILFSRQDLTMGWQTADIINGSYNNHKKFESLIDALNREL